MASTCVVEFEEAAAAAIARWLAEAGIETHRWWGLGCHAQPAFIDCPRTPLPVTDALAPRVLGLPFHLGLDDVDLFAVLAALGRGMIAERADSGDMTPVHLRALGAA